MTLFLFYAESLRRQIVESVGRVVRHNTTPEPKGAKLLKAIFKKLENDQIISRPESEGIQELLEHRNRIAHEIHLLSGDIEIPGRGFRLGEYLRFKYDYAAVERIKKWSEELPDRLRSKYVLSLSFDRVVFEAAEHAYEKGGLHAQAAN